MRGWWALATIPALAAVVASGCSVQRAGHAVPAAADRVAVSPAAVPEALLDRATIADIMGDPSMELAAERSDLPDTAALHRSRCPAIWSPVERSVYGHTARRAAVVRALSGPHRDSAHVVQGAVAFVDRGEARRFFDRAERSWASCARRRSTEPGGSRSWRIGPVSLSDTTLWLTRSANDAAGWSCQRALRLSHNVAIDVLACRPFVADEAVTIAHSIDARLRAEEIAATR